MTKAQTKNIIEQSGYIYPYEGFTTDEHELVIVFAAAYDPEAAVQKLVQNGIPREKIRMALIIESDETE